MLTLRPLLQLAVAVACRFPSNAFTVLELRIPLRKTRDQTPPAFGFRTQFQESLSERHIERQLGCDVVGKGDAALCFKARHLLVVKDSVALLVQFFELLGNAGIDPVKILFEIFDVGLDVGLVVVGADQMESLLSDRKDVGTAIVIFFQCLDDQRGAPGLRDVSVMREHNSERRSRIDTLPRHHAVARLENVQRDSLSGEENHTEREKRYTRGAHGRARAIIAEGQARICMCSGSSKEFSGYSFVRNKMSYSQPAATPPAIGPIQ
jgi:hypothetical protein